MGATCFEVVTTYGTACRARVLLVGDVPCYTLLKLLFIGWLKEVAHLNSIAAVLNFPIVAYKILVALQRSKSSH